MKIENFAKAEELVKQIRIQQEKLDHLTTSGFRVRIETPGGWGILTIEPSYRFEEQAQFLIKSIAFEIEEHIEEMKSRLNEL